MTLSTRSPVSDSIDVLHKMINADKAALDAKTKVRAIALRGKEMDVYLANARNLALLASLLAGIAYSALPYTTKMAYFADSRMPVRTAYVFSLAVLLGLSLEIAMACTALSLLSPGYGLRGPTGSMDVAVDRLIKEFDNLLRTFIVAIHFFLLFVIGSLAFSGVSVGITCSLAIVATTGFMSYVARRRKRKVEKDLPMQRVPLHSGAFFEGRGRSADLLWPGAAAVGGDGGLDSSAFNAPPGRRQRRGPYMSLF